MFRIDVSTHEKQADRFVRLTTEIGIIKVPISRWSFALANAGQCSPDPAHDRDDMVFAEAPCDVSYA